MTLKPKPSADVVVSDFLVCLGIKVRGLRFRRRRCFGRYRDVGLVLFYLFFVGGFLCRFEEAFGW